MSVQVGGPPTAPHVSTKVGSFAISTIDYDLWAQTPVTTTAQNNRKIKAAKQVVNPIFAACATIITDPFWSGRFTSASVGTFPKGFSYHDDILSYRKGARSYTLEVSKNVHEAAPACTEFFRVYGGIFSPTDQSNSFDLQVEHAQSAENQEELTWAAANKKLQECLINNYLSTMTQVMSLTTKETDQLRQTVKMGISHKYFGKENITVANNKICAVGGLLWNPDLREFYINPELKPIVTRSYARKKEGPAAVESTQKDTVPQFIAKWDKYLKILEKKESSYVRRVRRTTIRQQASDSDRSILISTNDTVTSPHTDTNSSLDEDYSEEDEE